jgi:hypothetical protein
LLCHLSKKIEKKGWLECLVTIALIFHSTQREEGPPEEESGRTGGPPPPYPARRPAEHTTGISVFT